MEVSDKDIYEYIVNLAEDRDVINMLSVNKKFNDDLYFKKILERRYPFLIKFKLENETYKHLYLRMVKYMAKLWEEYKIPYIPAKSFDPKFFSNMSKYYGNIYTESLSYAVEAENKKLIEYFLEKGGKFSSSMYYNVGKRGSLDILKFILTKFPPPYEWLQTTLMIPEDSGNRPVVKYLLDAGIKV